MGVVDSPEYPKIPVVIISSVVARDLIPDLRPAQGSVEAKITVDVDRKTFKTQNVLGLVCDEPNVQMRSIRSPSLRGKGRAKKSDCRRKHLIRNHFPPEAVIAKRREKGKERTESASKLKRIRILNGNQPTAKSPALKLAS
jgi:hypothetical protein